MTWLPTWDSWPKILAKSEPKRLVLFPSIPLVAWFMPNFGKQSWKSQQLGIPPFFGGFS